MSDPIDDADELRQWRELFARVMAGPYPLLPNPQWCQNVAFMAFVIDGTTGADR